MPGKRKPGRPPEQALLLARKFGVNKRQIYNANVSKVLETPPEMVYLRFGWRKPC